MLFQTYFHQIFAISTPSPLKIALKMTNIVKMVILANIECFQLRS